MMSNRLRIWLFLSLVGLALLLGIAVLWPSVMNLESTPAADPTPGLTGTISTPADSVVSQPLATGVDSPASSAAGSASTVIAAPSPASPDGKALALINDTRFTRLPDGRSLFNESVQLANRLTDDSALPIVDLESVDALFSAYIWAFKELPEGGENNEIVSGLTGKNPRQVVFLPEDHARLDRQGNLLDRWGTPYFFHKQSESLMEIVSAGPDRRLWSTDDLSIGSESTP